MPVKVSQQPWQTKRFKTDLVETYVAQEGELISDFRGAIPYLRLGDGVTPGGHIVMIGGTVGSIRKPQITAPLLGATGIDTAPYVSASAYSASGNDGGIDVQAFATWIFSLDAAGTNVIHNSGRTSTYLNYYDLQAAGVVLPNDTRVYVKVVYESAGGLEMASDASYFNTIAA